ncbi:MAG: hypothetical protein HRT47_11325 [Candidatus Caenarcaniphilales bacterium]|nr:hypothetical protein [Candidatus Caenarcaniphilales bacterium]
MYYFLKVSNKDGKNFINVQSTLKTDKHNSAYCAFLSPKAEIKGLTFFISDANKKDLLFLVLTDETKAQKLKEHLEKFIILEDVEIDLVSEDSLSEQDQGFLKQIPEDFNLEDYEETDSLVKLHQQGNHNILDKYFPEEKGCFPGQEVLSKYINIGLKKRAERAQEYTEEARDIFTQAEDKSEWVKAKELLNKAITEDPKNEEAYETLGVILGREENYKEAIEVMKKLDAVNPASIMAKTNLSIFYMRLGDKETAEEYKAKATVAQFDEALKK